jgi:hypothetical protein
VAARGILPVAPGSQLLSRPKELRKRTDEELEKLNDALLASAEAGTGDDAVIIAAVQYYTQELARRSQNRQTRWTIMTAAITIMTAVIMVATICPQWHQSIAQKSLLIRAAQVIDLWWPCG